MPTASPNPVRTAADLAGVCSLSPAAGELARPGLPLARYFDLLLERRLYADAIQALPHRLPRRAAVWWGCLCAWQANRPALAGPAATALAAALRWALEPTEEHRRAAEGPAQAAGMTTSAGALAWAAFWSGGSMLSQPDLPPVPPPPHVTAVVVAGAVLLAAVEREPMRFAEHYRLFLGLGLEVARGRLLWADRGPAPAGLAGEVLVAAGVAPAEVAP